MARSGWRAAATGAAALGIAAMLSLPAQAAASIEARDGTTLAVWEQGHALLYSVSTPSGTRVGQVPRTRDRASDLSPFLSLDPRTGSPVLVWSRSDGVWLKIAFARYTRGGWREMRLLTYGRGDDTAPRLGSSLYGSYLFFVSSSGEYMYAPVDLSRGALFAAPRALPVHLENPIPGPGARDLGAIWPNGGNDVPVVIGSGCDPQRPISCTNNGGSGGGSLPPPMPVPDAAFIVGPDATPRPPLWWVASRSACREQALVLPAPGGRTVTVLSFADGAVRPLRNLPVPPRAPEGFAAEVAEAALASLCD